jgi:hypothetical protein
MSPPVKRWNMTRLAQRITRISMASANISFFSDDQRFAKSAAAYDPTHQA